MNLKTFSLLLLVAAPAYSQEAFYFDPPYSPVDGGAVIRFVANDPSIDFLKAPAQIFFGDVSATHVSVIDARTLTAITPAHGEGAVSVELHLHGATYTSSRNFGFLRARDTLLIPIAIETAGGFGARWTTDIWVYNDSDENVNLKPEVCSFIGAIFPCNDPLLAPAHSSTKIPPRGFPELYLNPPNDVRDKLHFSVRVRDGSRDNIGTEIPVVPLTSYRSGRTFLVDVPVSDGVRSVLRVYDTGFPITVRVYDAASSDLLAERFSGFRSIPTDTPRRFSFSFFDLLSDPAVRNHARVRIEIDETNPEAVPAAIMVWAMLSLTDNATQRVAILTSQ